MKFKRLVSTLLIGALVFSATACGTASTPKEDKGTTAPTENTATKDDSTNNEPIIIGGIGPLTGNNSQYGVPALNGAMMAFEEQGTILGREIKFIREDDKGSMEDANNAYNKLVNNSKAIAIVGAITSQPSASIAAKSQADGIPMITPTGTAPNVTEQGPNIFRACFIDPFQGEVMANFASQKLNVKNAAILYNTDIDYSIGLYENFEKTFTDNGGTIVAKEGYSSADVDFKSQLTKIAATNPDVLFLPDYYEKVSLIAKQIEEIGLDTILLGADGWDGVLTTISDPKLIEGAYYCNHYSSESEDPLVKNFISSYKETYNADSNSFAALGYDAAKILIAAIEKAGSTDKDAIIKALNETDITSVTGKITFDENRNPKKSAAILQIKNGKDTFYETLAPTN